MLIQVKRVFGAQDKSPWFGGPGRATLHFSADDITEYGRCVLEAALNAGIEPRPGRPAKVVRVSDMPDDDQLCIEDHPSALTYYIEKGLITEAGARGFQEAIRSIAG